jgi:hypothetical protein
MMNLTDFIHMEQITTLKKLEAQEFRDYLRDNLDEQLVSAIVETKESMIPLLIKNKYVPDEITQQLTKTKEDASFILNSFIESGYIPSVKLIESLIEHGDELVLQLLKSFPSLPISTQLFMKILNHQLNTSAIYLLKTKKEFQKDEPILLLARTGSDDVDLVRLATSSTRVMESIIADELVSNYASSSGYEYCREIVSFAVLNYEVNYGCALHKFKLTKEAYKKVFSSMSSGQKGTEYAIGHWHGLAQLNWNQEIEESIDSLPVGLNLIEVPKFSKFRSLYLLSAPQDGSDEELINLNKFNLEPDASANSRRKGTGSRVARELLKRSTDTMTSFGIEKLFGLLSPSMVENEITRDTPEQKIKFLIDVAPSKFRNAIMSAAKHIEFDQTIQKKKTSYFFEIFSAIKESDIDKFREYCSLGYSLETFAKDTHQKTKMPSCEQVRLGKEFLAKITKDEFWLLASTPMQFHRNYYVDENSVDFRLSFTLKASEAVRALDKLEVSQCFNACSEKPKFIQLIDADTATELYRVLSREILADNSLRKVFLAKIKKLKELDLPVERISELCAQLSQPDLIEIISLKDSYDKTRYSYESSDLIDLKCRDGQYLIDEATLLDMMRSQSILENTGFMNKLVVRDRQLATKVVAAYLEGNKALSTVLGDSVNIRRKEVKYFSSLKSQLTQSTETVIDEFFAQPRTLKEIEKTFVNWLEYFTKNAVGKTLFIVSAKQEDLNKFADIPGVNFQITSVSVYKPIEITRPCGNLRVETLVIEPNYNTRDKLDEILDSIVKTKVLLGCEKVTFPQLSSVSKRLHIFRKGIQLEEDRVLVERILSDPARMISSDFTFDDLKYLEDNGLVFVKSTVAALLNSFFDKAEVIDWLSARVGGLKDFALSEMTVSFKLRPQQDDDKSSESDAERKEQAKAFLSLSGAGVRILNEDDYVFHETRSQLLAQGEHFVPINISELSTKQKIQVIRFIEDKIDPNYKKLNLTAMNIDEMDILCPFSDMKKLYSLDAQDIIKLLKIPSNIVSNKKAMKNVMDLVSIKSSKFIAGINNLIDTVAIINPKIELGFDDFVSCSAQAEVVETPLIASLKYSVMTEFLRANLSTICAAGFFHERDKTNLLRFIRSSNAQTPDYIRDVFEFINSILNGVRALEEREVALRANQEEEAAQAVAQSVAGILKRLEEVSVMDDIEHLHDRLVPLCSFIKNDPSQPLGQDRFKKLEFNREIANDIGVSLYFPKVREDVQYLGENNGWCVSHTSSYSDNVIAKGHIMVGLCKKGTEPVRENVIALAYYLNEGDGTYRLEQLKWSSKQKGGTRNVDATRDFKHHDILAAIMPYIKKLKGPSGS